MNEVERRVSRVSSSPRRATRRPSSPRPSAVNARARPRSERTSPRIALDELVVDVRGNLVLSRIRVQLGEQPPGRLSARLDADRTRDVDDGLPQLAERTLRSGEVLEDAGVLRARGDEWREEGDRLLVTACARSFPELSTRIPAKRGSRSSAISRAPIASATRRALPTPAEAPARQKPREE